jgi:DNA repair protein RecN (Recombination protein N)
MAEKMEVQPERMQQLEDRLNLLRTLQQKHSCHTIEDLLRLKQRYADELEMIDNSDERINELTEQLENAQNEMKAAGEKLTASRKKIKKTTEDRLITQLKRLGIPHPNFQIEYAESKTPTKNGMDEINFLFAANKNQTLRNVADVASGGEVARLMLCLKSLLAEHRSLPTLIFDEIDTGVSGEVASQMALIMRNMAQYMQVMAITHLPQIAAKGNVHYKVYKQDADEHTETQIKRLTQEERVVEIAQVLSGKNVSEAALQNARELLQE